MDALFRKVMAVRRPVVFRVRHLLYGWVYPEIAGSPIYINLARCGDESATYTYLHECLHCVYPEKEEDEIVALSDRMWASMSPRQRFLLSRKLYCREWRTE